MSEKRQWYDHRDVSKEEKEKIQRRVQWMITQERLRQHEKQKRKAIEEYERNRAKMLGLDKKRRSSERRSRSDSRSRSRSEDSHHRSRLKSNSTSRNRSKTAVMSEKFNSINNKPFFRGPEDAPKIDPEELKLITVKIHRNIPSASETNEIRRDIVNREDITVKRRDGEGSKPIFDREELKQSDPKPLDEEEHRVVEAVGKCISVKRNCTKQRSASLSPRRRRSPSPHVHSSSRASYTHRSRSDVHVKSHHTDHYRDHKSDRYHSRSRDSSREDKRRRSSTRSSRARSHSRDRNRDRSDRDYSRSSRSEKDYKDNDYHRDSKEYRGRSSERFHDRRERRDLSLDRHHPPVPYPEQVPYPVYYGPYPPRPVMLGPPVMPPIRGPIGRGRPPVAPIRAPFPPRFVGPQDMYRPAILPPDPRFRRMY